MKNYGHPKESTIKAGIAQARDNVVAHLTNKETMYIIAVPDHVLDAVKFEFAVLEWELFGAAKPCPDFVEPEEGGERCARTGCGFMKRAHNNRFRELCEERDARKAR